MVTLVGGDLAFAETLHGALVDQGHRVTRAQFSDFGVSKEGDRAAPCDKGTAENILFLAEEPAAGDPTLHIAQQIGRWPGSRRLPSSVMPRSGSSRAKHSRPLLRIMATWSGALSGA